MDSPAIRYAAASVERSGGVTSASNAVALLLVCGVAAAARAAYWIELSGSPWLEYLFCDEIWFDALAQEILRGEPPGGAGAYDQPPAYGYFLASLYALLGRDLPAVRAVQLLLGVVNSGLLYLVARRAVGPKLALASGLVFAVWAPLFFFEAQLLKTVLVVFFNLLFFYALLRCIERPGWGWGLAAGVLFGASSITQPIALPFLGVLAVWGWLRFRREPRVEVRRAWLAAAGALVAGTALVVGTVAVRNAVVGGEAVLISSNSGINLYLGVGSDFREKVATRPGRKWDALYAREDDEYLGESLRIIAHDPIGYVANGGTKLLRFANGHEAPRCRSLYAARKASSLFSFLLWKRGVAFPFGLLFPLAVLGSVAVVRSGSTGARLMLLFCATHVLLLCLLFVTARFRMHVLPFLIVLASVGGAQLVGLGKRRAWPAAAVWALALAALLVVSNWRVGPMRQEPFADVYWTLGMNKLREGRPRRACRHLERAAYLEPEREAEWSRYCSKRDRTPRDPES